MAHIPERRKTERRKDDEAVRRSEEKYRTILESIEEGYYEEDLAGNFTFLNNSMCRIYGYSHEELMGMNYRKYTDKETAKKLFQVFNNIYKTGSTNIGYSYEIIRKDGVRRYIEASASIKKDLSDKPIGFRGIVRDVTEHRQAEEALERSEEKYRMLLDNASDAVLLANEKGNLLEVNKRAEDLLGYTRKELLGVNISQIHPTEERGKIIKGFQEIKTRGLWAVNDTAVLRKDGKTVSVDISGNVIDYRGQIILQGIFRDITERKKAEETLRRSEARYRNIIETIPDGYFEVDLAGNFIFVNDVICQHHGYSKEEMLKMNNSKLQDEQNAKKVYRAVKEVYETGIPVKLLETEYIEKDGIKRTYELSISSIMNSANKPIGFRGIARDINDRKRMEEDLRKSEEKYRRILESIREGYFEVDLDGNYTFVNEANCRYLGYTKQELIGMNYRKHTSEENAKKLYKPYLELYRTGKPIETLELESITKDGTKVIHETSISLIRGEGGKPIGFRGVSRDVTERKKMEEELRKSEEKYRSIIENMQESYFENDLAGNFTFVNDTLCRNLGYSREELIGKSNRQYVDENTAKKIYQIYNRIYRTGEAEKRIELESIRKDGTKGFAELSVSLIRDPEGNPIGFRNISRDITERKWAEDALCRNEEKYRTILEEINDGYYEIDLNGNYTFFNEAEAINLGYTKEELLGMNSRQYQDEATYKKTYQAFLEIYRTGQPIKALEMEVIRKDGTKRFNEISASLIRDVEGKPAGFRGITRDITERKQMEDALRQSEERYRTILEDIEEGYFEVDLSGSFIFLNESMFRMFGYHKEELMGMNYKHYTDKENGRKCFQAYNKIYRTGEPGKIYDYEIIRKDGTKKYIESHISLQRDASGNPVGFRGINHDISERKVAEDALRKNQEELIKKNMEVEESKKNVQLTLEKLGVAYEELKTTQSKIIQQEKMASIGQLAAGVAHEVNNPMAFIASNLGTLNKYIQRLKEFIEVQSETIKSLKAADAIKKLEKKRKELKLDYTIGDIDLLVKESLEGSERVQSIVRGLNRFSRADDEEYKDAYINECIESSIKIVWNELKNKATLYKDYGNLPQTKCYPLRLSQVFVNVFINATHAMEEKGTIKIKTWQEDNAIWITISDTGHGISKNNQSKIFEPFFTTKEAGRGTGLGLSVSYGIIQQHKGEISFKSEKGKGTTFTIRIPIV